MLALSPILTRYPVPAVAPRRDLASGGGGDNYGPTYVYIDARGLPYRDPPARDAAASAARLPPATEVEDVRPVRPSADPRWMHQALTPLPTEGYLAMRAATAQYRRTA